MTRLLALTLVLGMQVPTPSHSVATCDFLEAAPHENVEGFFNCGKFSISVPPDGVTADILREYVASKKPIDIIIRVREPRGLNTIARTP